MRPGIEWANKLKEKSRQQWEVSQEEIEERIASRRRQILSLVRLPIPPLSR